MATGISEFLEAIFSDAPADGRRVAIFTLPDRRTQLFTDLGEAADCAARAGGAQDTYFGLGLVGGNPAGRGKASDVVGIGTLWADIDCAAEYRKGTAKLPATIDEARDLVQQMPLAPSCVVHSGHGLHAYWFLVEPRLFGGASTEAARAAALAHDWHALICEKARRKGWSLENLGELARVLRLPGTLNHKSDPAQPVEVLEWSPELRYSPDDFEPYLLLSRDFLPAGHAPAVAAVPAGLSLVAGAEPPADKLVSACEKAAAFRRTWSGENGRLDDQSDSGYDLSLASMAVAAGWSDQEVANLIIAFRRRRGSEEKALRPDYIQRTLSRAHKQSKGEKTAEKSRADVLLELAKSAELWRNGDTAFCTLEIGGHYEHWPLAGRQFREWLAYRYHKATTHGTSSSALQDAVVSASAVALYEGRSYEMGIRLGEFRGDIYLDLCNDDWQVVRITRRGWSVVDASPIRFRRVHGMEALPAPVEVDQHELRSLLNVTDEGWMLVAAWLLAAMRPTGPYPVLCLLGEPGCAKSTIARVLRRLVDPNLAPLRRQPETMRDLAIAANNSWILAMDNLSRIGGELSDALCRLATGGGFATRALYQDTDETLLDATRPVILTGTQELATRGDLLDRCLTVELPTITDQKRLTEKELDARFDSLRAGILGAVCSAVSTALFNLPHVNLAALPRMADFAVWATAGLPGFGVHPSEFLHAYDRSLAGGNQVALESSPIAEILGRILEEYPVLQGTAADVLRALNAEAPDDMKKQRNWPKSARALAGAIRRIAGNLRREGIVVERWRESGTGRRLIKITKGAA